jgi:hypothetical protein
VSIVKFFKHRELCISKSKQNKMKNDQETITGSPEEVKNLLSHHLDSFLENDLDRVMIDYTEESVVITEQNTLKGLKEIKVFF